MVLKLRGCSALELEGAKCTKEEAAGDFRKRIEVFFNVGEMRRRRSNVVVCSCVLWSVIFCSMECELLRSGDKSRSLWY